MKLSRIIRLMRSGEPWSKSAVGSKGLSYLHSITIPPSAPSLSRKQSTRSKLASSNQLLTSPLRRLSGRSGIKLSVVFLRYDYFVVPTAQVFPFNADLHWPQEIDGKKMETYHEWMKAVLLVSMTGCPALAVPAGFGDSTLPIGIQIIGPSHRDLECLQLAYAYTAAANWTNLRFPSLLQQN
jgi:Asp-tRNA(Asn)/Glu-tRNA(Gln) amidotransferase A subunit family amidase